MSSPTSAVSKEQSYREEIWMSVASYCKSPVAAAIGFMPSYYLFAVKIAQQLEKPIPRMSVSEIFKGGLKASPTVGTLVGLQMIVQNVVERTLKKTNVNEQPSVGSMLASSVVVGFLSAPPLAVLNGQIMGQKAIETLRRLNVKQVGAIVVRETSFLASFKISDPVTRWLNSKLGDNHAVTYVSTFISAAAVSGVGHGADTALTNWQHRRKITKLSALMRGVYARCLAVGIFAVSYKFVDNQLQNQLNRYKNK